MPNNTDNTAEEIWGLFVKYPLLSYWQNKQWERNSYYLQGNMYILKLLLNLVTARTEALAYCGICVVCPCQRSLPPVSSATFYNFHQFLIIVEVLWPQPVLQVGKQVTVPQREIRAVRRVVNQPSAEMLQQCSSVSRCMSIQTHTVIEEHTFCSERSCMVF
jgi:hypothetical protein